MNEAGDENSNTGRGVRRDLLRRYLTGAVRRWERFLKAYAPCFQPVGLFAYTVGAVFAIGADLGGLKDAMILFAVDALSN